MLGLLLLIAAPVSAMWEKLSDADLIAKSDVIVRGELVGLTTLQIAAGQPPLSVAGLQVRERFKGGEETLVLLAEPSAQGPISSSDIRHPRGANGLWFLRPRPGGPVGVFLADHPQRFVSEAKEPERFQALLKLVQARPPR